MKIFVALLVAALCATAFAADEPQESEEISRLKRTLGHLEAKLKRIDAKIAAYPERAKTTGIMEVRQLIENQIIDYKNYIAELQGQKAPEAAPEAPETAPEAPAA